MVGVSQHKDGWADDSLEQVASGEEGALGAMDGLKGWQAVGLPFFPRSGVEVSIEPSTPPELYPKVPYRDLCCFPISRPGHCATVKSSVFK